VQTCVLHLIENSFRYASKADWAELAKDLRPVYGAPTEQAAAAALEELESKWGDRYPAIIRLWRNAWAEFVPFLSYSPEIRRVIYSTNAIESMPRPLPPRRQSPRPLPDRAGRSEMLVPHRPQPRPHRPRPPTLEQPLEARPQRLRRHLRRTNRDQRLTN
jgi:putative transposase